MDKEIKDYLHLYLGCQAEIQFKDGTIGITRLECAHIEAARNTGVVPMLKGIRLVLRKLSDMTEEEMNECGNLIYDFSDDEELNRWKWSDFDFGCAEQFHWLLSKHFDLFGLIEAGLAIDSTTLNKCQ